MQDYRKLWIWEQAHELTLDIYQSTAGFPETEKYALTSQLRRAASSVPANLAEGCARNSSADLARFIQIAIGSVSAVSYFLQLAKDLGYLSPGSQLRLESEALIVRKGLIAFQKRVWERQATRKSA